MTPPVFFAAGAGDPVELGATVELEGDEGRHAADVRRLRVGERLVLTDGMGNALECDITSVRRGALSVVVLARKAQPCPSPAFVAVQALAKGGRDEAAVGAMTEVGVDEIVGWSAERSIARWTDRTQSKWESTIRTAAKQARRVWWPTVTGPASTADVAGLLGGADLAVVLHESAPESLASLAVPAAGRVAVVIGPEGGISDAELAAFMAAGACVVGLGTSVLRSSTAGVAALSVLSAASRWA